MSGLKVERIGSGGDGVAEGPDGPVYVPFGLPGEIYEQDAGGYFSLKGPDSDQRIAARCQHFGVCGGCTAQHMRSDVYEAWKRGLVAGAFNAQGLATPEFSFVSVAAGTRRRCTLTAARARDGIRLGFHAEKSHDLIGLRECPVLMDAIVSRFDGLAAVANTMFGMMSKKAREGNVRLQVSALGGALDVAIDAAGVTVDADGRTQLADLAERHGFQRIAIGDDVVVLRDVPPLVTSAGVITPPPGAFFQAVESAERTMAEAVVAGLGKSKRVADLFSGIGTFTLPIAARARVMAIDSDKAALVALKEAANRARGLKPISTLLRDLVREPLSPMELADYDAVVLDPPRAGAKAQAEALAKSKIATVVMVVVQPSDVGAGRSGAGGWRFQARAYGGGRPVPMDGAPRSRGRAQAVTPHFAGQRT